MIHFNDPFLTRFCPAQSPWTVGDEADLDGLVVIDQLSVFALKIISKRMTAPAKPKQMSPFGLESKFLPGRHRLLKLKNIRKRPELRFWFTRWTLKRGLIEI